MKVIIVSILLISVFFFSSCNEKKKSSFESFKDSLIIAEKVDSMMESIMTNAMFDTVGLQNAPVQVIKARFVTKEYSNYKDISLTYKNVSGKDISAIRFRWHGTNAFGRPADMGTSLQEGFGGGFDDDILRKGKTVTNQWSILSKDGKKITLAWPTEVVFEDGTKWETSK